MTKKLLLVLLMSLVANVYAVSVLPEDFNKVLERADFVAIVEVIRSDLIEENGKPCGIVHTVRFISSIRGGANEKTVEILTSENLSILGRYVVFFSNEESYLTKNRLSKKSSCARLVGIDWYFWARLGSRIFEVDSTASKFLGSNVMAASKSSFFEDKIFINPDNLPVEIRGYYGDKWLVDIKNLSQIRTKE
jgi:hypothetical protein